MLQWLCHWSEVEEGERRALAKRDAASNSTQTKHGAEAVA